MNELGKLCKVFPGKTPAKAVYANSGDVKIIKFRDVLENGEVDFYNEEVGWVNSAYDDISDLVELLSETILLTNAAHSTEHIGKKVAYVDVIPKVAEKVCFVGELTGIRAKSESLSIKWLSYWLQTIDAKKEIARAIEGAHLIPRQFKRIKLPDFSIEEQNRQIAVLGKVDEAIAKARTEFDAKYTLKSSILKQLLSIGLNSKYSDIIKTKFGHFSSAWEFKSIAEYCGTPECVKTGPFGAQLPPESFAKQGMRFVNITDIGDGRLDFSEEVYVKDSIAEKLKEYQLHGGDLVFSRVASVGRVAMIPETSSPMMMSSNCIRLRATQSFNSMFLMYLFTASNLVRRQVSAMATGGSRPIVTPRFLRQILLPRPTMDEQNEIVKALSFIEEGINSSVVMVEILVNVKKSLLHNLLTGKIRLPPEAFDGDAGEIAKT